MSQRCQTRKWLAS